MTAVVTGASGHLGANLVRRLLERGTRVRAVVHRRTLGLEDLDVEMTRADVLDPESLRAAFGGAEVVYHLAGVISVVGDPAGMVRAVNVLGAENAARAALACGARRLVHCSSIHALDLRRRGAVDESAPVVPDGPGPFPDYDRSKAEGERRVRAVAAEGLDAVIVRPASVIGPEDFAPSRLGRVLLRLYHRTLPALVGGGFDFVDVRDVAGALVAAADRQGAGDGYVLSGHYRTIRELAGLAAAVTGRRPPLITLPLPVARLGAPLMRLWARLARTEPLYTAGSLEVLRLGRQFGHALATRDLGYRPRPLEQTVYDTYRWFAARGVIPADAVLTPPPGGDAAPDAGGRE